MTVRPAKSQISLGIRQVWSELLPCAFWLAKDPMFLQAVIEDSDQTGRLPRLIWVFAGSTCHLVGFAMRQLNLSFFSAVWLFKTHQGAAYISGPSTSPNYSLQKWTNGRWKIWKLKPGRCSSPSWRWSLQMCIRIIVCNLSYRHLGQSCDMAIRNCLGQRFKSRNWPRSSKWWQN